MKWLWWAPLGPLVACGLLNQILPALANTSAALILVLVIVAAACTGYRSAGVIAAISAGAWFDFFLTAPYLTFSVTSAADVETLIVLVLLGVVVNEVIHWGRRYQFQLRIATPISTRCRPSPTQTGGTDNGRSMPSAATS